MALAEGLPVTRVMCHMKNSTDLSLGKTRKYWVEGEREELIAPDARMACKLLCSTRGHNFKSRFVKAGHEQVRTRKCILFLRKIMITKRTKTKFILLKGLRFKNVLHFV